MDKRCSAASASNAAVGFARNIVSAIAGAFLDGLNTGEKLAQAKQTSA